MKKVLLIVISLFILLVIPSGVKAVYPGAVHRKFLFGGLFLAMLILSGTLTFTSTAYGATEFVSVVDPDSGSGTDYTSLYNWEAANQVDLTASTTKVFSHGGITGTISDGDTVTGANSSATATVVHATSTQILLKSISGTFQSGEQIYQTQNVNYVISSDTGDSAISVAKCRSTGGTADTISVSAFLIDGWTTSATNYIKIWTDPSENYRHSGVAGTGHYRLWSTGPGNAVIEVNEDHVLIDGLEIKQDGSGTSDECIRMAYNGGTLTVKNTILWANVGVSDQDGIYAGLINCTINAENVIAFNFARAAFHPQIYNSLSKTQTWNLNSCTAYNNSQYGIYEPEGGGVTAHAQHSSNTYNINIFNCVFMDSEGGSAADYDTYYEVSTVNWDIHNSIDSDGSINSRDASASGCLTSMNATDDDSKSSDGDWIIFEDITSSPYDLRLATNDYNEAQDAHATSSGAGLTMPSTDIVGTSRPQNTNYDIGAFEIAAADSTPPVRSGGSPTGVLSSGTTQTDISLTTDENATCKYDTSSGTAYASMPNTFSTTGTTSHSTTVSSLSDGNSYTYYVRCEDGASNANTDDYEISFSVASDTPTEFISVIDPDNGAGTDYTSLFAWEAANEVDLTASSTKVFSHGGITGTIDDGDTVTGANSSATATVVHATSTQILLKSISGTFQSSEQIYETQNVNYVTSSDTGNSAIAAARCRSTEGTADTTTTQVSISGSWATSATNYIKIYTDPADRHNGVWDDTKYRLVRQSSSNGRALITATGAANIIIDGLQISAERTSGVNYSEPLAFNTSGQYSYLSNSILKIVKNATYGAWGSGMYVGYGTIKAWNNLIYATDTDSDGDPTYAIYAGGGSFYAYNVSSINFDYGFRKGSGVPFYVKNCGFSNVSTQYLDGTPATETTSSTSTPTFVNASINDYRLQSADTTWKDQGTDLSSDGDVSFNDDLQDDTRSGSWDIGADEYTSPPGDFLRIKGGVNIKGGVHIKSN